MKFFFLLIFYSSLAFSQDSSLYNSERIVYLLSKANQGEILAAKHAHAKLKTREAKDFALMMIREHEANEREAQELIKRNGIIPQENSFGSELDKKSNLALTQILATSEEVDKLYLQSQIEIHKMLLNNLDNLYLPNVQEASLRSFLIKTREHVSHHLSSAQEILGKLK